MNDQKSRGDRGEETVAAALVRQGWEILERQYRCRWGEIDLIGWAPEGVLCFVEVKTRSDLSAVTAREAVTMAKQRKLRTAAGWYLAQKGLDCACRFDVVEVYLDASGDRESPHINYIINAFQ